VGAKFAFCKKPNNYDMKCPLGKSMKAECKVQSKTCIYLLKCEMKENSEGIKEWTCDENADHKTNDLICCDLHCRINY